MSRYIDKDKLLAKYKSDLEYPANPLIWGVVEAVEKAPEEDDVVEVVRCKDCKYYQDNNGGYPHPECRWSHDETPNEDDYCSYGERKE